MELNLCKWMENLNSDTPVLQYNIPGTHDCATQYVQLPHLARCQSLNIYEQLCIGVRALDIRVQSEGERLKMVHGIAKAFNTANHFGEQMDMSDVLEHCYRFLDENPSEAIIFQFKNDSGTENEKCFDNLFYTYIKGNESRWFLENRVPTLGEARGKIFLIRRCKMENREEFTDLNTGLDFSKWAEQDEAVPDPLPLETGSIDDAVFIIQDRFAYKPEPRWNECLKPFLDKSAPFDKTYIVNYLSTAGGLKGPYKNSEYINPRFIEYPLNADFYYGTVYCDFPSTELTAKIIETNYKNK